MPDRHVSNPLIIVSFIMTAAAMAEIYTHIAEDPDIFYNDSHDQFWNQ